MFFFHILIQRTLTWIAEFDYNDTVHRRGNHKGDLLDKMADVKRQCLILF